MPTVHIPASLRNATDGQSTLQIAGVSTDELLAKIRSDHPQLAERILDSDGRLLPHIQMFVGESQVNSSEPVSVDSGSEVLLVSPLAGG
ncbi:MAG: MoaD/ThiS family protein [Aureliella sp.]